MYLISLLFTNARGIMCLCSGGRIILNKIKYTHFCVCVCVCMAFNIGLG